MSSTPAVPFTNATYRTRAAERARGGNQYLNSSALPSTHLPGYVFFEM